MICRLDVVALVAQMNGAATAGMVLRLLADAFRPFGSSSVLANIDLPRGPPGLFAETGLPTELSVLLARRNYLQLSPVGRLARRSFVPVHWTKKTWIDEPDPRVREVMHVIASFGFHEGCVIPVRGPRGLEADISLAGDKVSIPQDSISLVHCLAYYGFVRLRDLLTVQRQSPRPLTMRDRDVLTLSARGKSTAEIAAAMGIAERTVEEHVRHACRRLGAQNRTQAVAIAVGAGYIDI